MFAKRIVKCVVCVMTLGGVMAFGGVGGVAAIGATQTMPTAITVPTANPTTGLVDGQAVTLNVPTDTQDVVVALCRAGEDNTCWTLSYGVSGQFLVYTPSVFGPSGTAIDCRVVECDIAIGVATTTGTQITRIPVSFDPSAPLLPDPIWTLDPSGPFIDGDVLLLSGLNLFPTPQNQLPIARTTLYQICVIDTVAPGSDCSNVINTFPTVYVSALTDNSDCRVIACELRMYTWHPRIREFAIPLAFVPGSPLSDPVALNASPSTTTVGAAVTIGATDLIPGVSFSLDRCEGDVCTQVAYGDVPADGSISVETTLCSSPNTECVFRLTNLFARGELTVTTSQVPGATAICDSVYDFTVTEGIPYRTATDYQGNAASLALDVYEPAGDPPSDLRPALLWMHGGYFAFGSRSDAAIGPDFARRGYVVISIDYRKRPMGADQIPTMGAVTDTYEDASAAIEWIVAHSDDYRIDTDSIVAAGFSAGAITAMNLAYWDPAEGEFDPSPTLAGVAGVGGFIWPGGGEIDEGEPGAALIQGSADPIVPPSLPVRTCELAAAVSVHCQVDMVDEGGHWPASNDYVFGYLADFFGNNVFADRPYCGRSVVPEPSTTTTAAPVVPTTTTVTSTTGIATTSTTTDPGNGLAPSPVAQPVTRAPKSVG